MNRAIPSVKKSERDGLYRDIIKAVMSVLKKYPIKDIRWALNRWAKTEASKARLKREIAERQQELRGIK